MKVSPYKFNVVQRRAALALFAAGWTQEDIAGALSIRRQTIYYAQKKDLEFSQAIAKAVDERDAHVESALLKSALSGNVTAQIFWLKNRQPEHWRDVMRQEVEQHSVELVVHYDASSQPS